MLSLRDALLIYPAFVVVVDAVAVAAICTACGIAARPSARLALILAAQHRTVIGDFGVRRRRHTRDRILIGPIWMDALPVITVLAVKLLRVGRHDRSDRCAASKACKQAERKSKRLNSSH